MKPRIIITGVAGFIGSNLADFLIHKGYQVVGIDNLSYGLESQIPEGVEFHKVDILSPEIFNIIKKDDVIFHLAAKNCISDCQQDPVETAHINVTGTVNVFEAARKNDAKKVIYAESSALYEGDSSLPSIEETINPESFYAVSKLAGMAFAEAYTRYYGLKTTALRYFCAYGPRQDYRRTIPPVMSAFILKLMHGEQPTIYGDGTKRRDFVHVDDINEFHLMCIEDQKTDNEVFNLGSGVSHSVNDILAITKELLNSNIEAVHADDMPGEALETLANINKAKAIGWEPKVDLREGLKSFVKYYQENEIPWPA